METWRAESWLADARRATPAVLVSQLWRWFSDARHFEDSAHDALAAQKRKLLNIVRANRETVFGRAHGFGSIDEIAEYQRNVPISSYESLAPYIERMATGEHGVLTAEAPLMFAMTSGTTGKSKLIPVTPSSLAEYNHAVQTHTWRVLEDHPDAGVGQFLVTSSRDVEGHTSAGIPYGALSGLVVRRQPALVRSHFALPFEIGQITDVDLKYYLTLRLALTSHVTALSSLNPSTLVLLCQKLQQYQEALIWDVRHGTASALGALPDWLERGIASRLAANPRRADELASLVRASAELRPTEVWPDLAVVLCWKGGTMPLYFRQLRRWFPGLPIRDRGYLASEGCGSIPLQDAGSAGALAITATFFEFVPVEARDRPDPPVLTCAELQPGQEYYVLFTTSAGLYRYDINDVIRVTGFYHEVPLIEFVRKGRGMTSLTGEKLAEQQVTAAMLRTVEEIAVDAEPCGGATANALVPDSDSPASDATPPPGLEARAADSPRGEETAIRHFTAVPQFPQSEQPPRYAFFLELGLPLTDVQLRALAARLDHALSEQNVEYEAKRESLRLGPPLLRVVAPGTFEAYRQQQVSGGAPEAQVKVPHLTPDREFGRRFAVIREIDASAG